MLSIRVCRLKELLPTESSIHHGAKNLGAWSFVLRLRVGKRAHLENHVGFLHYDSLLW